MNSNDEECSINDEDYCTSTVTDAAVVTDRRALFHYTPPQWAMELKNCPEYRLHLLTSTPIEKWKLPGLPKKHDFQVFIKRDDLVGGAFCGTKARKMEFLMAKAVQQKCDIVITMGGEQSNHCRITAAIARQLDMNPHLLIRTTDRARAVDCKGNTLLNCLMGSKILLCSCNSQKGITHRNMEYFMDEYADILRAEGANPFVVNLNRPDFIGIWGYIEMFNELTKQGVLSNYDDIVVAVASGATVTGLAIANYLTGAKLKIHGVCVCDSADYFYKDCNSYVIELGLVKEKQQQTAESADSSSISATVTAQELIDLIEYSTNTSDDQGMQELKEQAFLMKISTETGILLDRTYTVKAVQEMLNQMQTNPGRFQGKRVLFIHTGGLFMIFDGEINDPVRNYAKTNQIFKLDNLS